MASSARAQLEPALQRAAAALRVDGGSCPEGLDATNTAVTEAVTGAIRSLRELGRAKSADEPTGPLVRRLVELLEVREEIADARFGECVAGLASIRAALARLAEIDDAASLTRAVCPEACGACGTERAMLSRVSGAQWIPEAVHWAGDPAGAELFLSRARERRNPLRHGLVETTMVRERRSVLVRDTAREAGIHRTLIAAARSTAYVAAPIVSAGRVIGFLHADHGERGAVVSTLDRDLVQVFAEGLGPILETVVLRDRLRVRHREVATRLRGVDASLGRLAEARIDLLPVAEAGAGEGPGATVAARSGRALTDRELEVLRLMATGAGNGAIAEALFLAPGTVKGHVRRILRKVGAVNRAEAVLWYVQHALPPGDVPHRHMG